MHKSGFIRLPISLTGNTYHNILINKMNILLNCCRSINSFCNLLQKYTSVISNYVNQVCRVNFSGIIFHLNAEVNDGGNMLLKKITSYSTKTSRISVYEKYDIPDNFLSIIIESWNARLEKICEMISNKYGLISCF